MSEGKGTSGFDSGYDAIQKDYERRALISLNDTRQKAFDGLKGTKPGDPLYDAFSDLVDLREKEVSLLQGDPLGDGTPIYPGDFKNIHMLKEDGPLRRVYEKVVSPFKNRIDERRGKDDAYRKASDEELDTVLGDYWTALGRTTPGPNADVQREIKFVQGLKEIKGEIDRKSPPPIPPQQ